MRLRVLWVGKTKEKFLADGIAEYGRRIAGLASLDMVEIREEKGVPVETALKREGERIVRQGKDYALLDERGRALSSLELAAWLKDRPSAEFVLGGAYGVSDEVRASASGTIALSSMTLTHEMSRLLLLEQLYRALLINSGRGGYHH